MRRETISSPAAPAAIGPYSQAIRLGDLVFCAGQIPLDPRTGALVSGDIAAQTERVLKNLACVLEAAGLGLDRVVKTTVFLVDFNDFAAMNEVYGRVFGDTRPARSTVEVSKLPKGARIEIEAIAG